MTLRNEVRVAVAGVGTWSPAFRDWISARRILAGGEPVPEHAGEPARPSWLPEQLRRRCGAQVRLALAVADQAVTMSGVQPAALATVFSASGGDGVNCHALCSELAGERQISPIKFLNSVQNTAAGLWHIAHASQAASTNLAAHDSSFGAGLLEAAVQCVSNKRPILFTSADHPYPEPLHGVRPLAMPFGVALVLQVPAENTLPELSVALRNSDCPDTPCRLREAEALRLGSPAARCLPVLECIATGSRRNVSVRLGPSAVLNIHCCGSQHGEVTPIKRSQVSPRG